jgi:hypothetical protein
MTSQNIMRTNDVTGTTTGAHTWFIECARIVYIGTEGRGCAPFACAEDQINTQRDREERCKQYDYQED